jgi:hypothetical protein
MAVHLAVPTQALTGPVPATPVLAAVPAIANIASFTRQVINLVCLRALIVFHGKGIFFVYRASNSLIG